MVPHFHGDSVWIPAFAGTTKESGGGRRRVRRTKGTERATEKEWEDDKIGTKPIK